MASMARLWCYKTRNALGGTNTDCDTFVVAMSDGNQSTAEAPEKQEMGAVAPVAVPLAWQ
jgi:hypothetical protein